MKKIKTTLITMKKILQTKITKIIILTIFSLTCTYQSFAQVKIDTSSDPIFFLPGNVTVRIHKLKNGESLFSLAKVYNIPLSQIFTYNDLPKNIKPGTYIFVPRPPFPIKSLIDTTICCFYQLPRHTSIHHVCRNFAISCQLLVKFNPELMSHPPKHGMLLKIPYIKYPHDYSDSFFIYHAYKRGETPEIISLLYKVPVEQIMQFNDSSNFKINKIIAIPKQFYDSTQTSLLKATYIKLPSLITPNNLLSQNFNNPPCQNYSETHPSTINHTIAFILPLYTNENYMAISDMLNNKSSALFQNSPIFYQYLFGALLALKDLSLEYKHLTVYIFDSENDSTKVHSILNNPLLQNAELIFGPVYSQYYNLVRNYTQFHHTFFVSPLSRNHNILKNNPYVILANPSDKMLMQRIAQYLMPRLDSGKIYILTDYSNYTENLANMIIKQINSLAKQKFLLDTVNIQKIYFDPTQQYKPESYKSVFSAKTRNFVIIPSNTEVFVDGALNMLNALHSVFNYNITVFGMPSWENFKNIDPHWLTNLNIHYPSAYYLSLQNPYTNSFIHNYIATYHTIPSYASYLGYDITYYFISALVTYGPTFPYCLTKDNSVYPPKIGTILSFSIKKDAPNNGFENNSVFMLYYDKNLNIHFLNYNKQTSE